MMLKNGTFPLSENIKSLELLSVAVW